MTDNITKVAVQPAKLPPLKQLQMGGRFAGQATIVPLSYTSLLLGTGQIAESKTTILIPFVEVSIRGFQQNEISELDTDAGEEIPKTRELFGHTLSLDNAVWLTYDMAHDLRQACSDLKSTVGDNAKLDRARLAYTRHYADQLRLQAEACVAHLDDILTDRASDRTTVPTPTPQQKTPVSGRQALQRRVKPRTFVKAKEA